MTANIIEINVDSDLVEISASGKLTKEFYDEFVPAVEKIIDTHRKVRILFVLQDFHGWTASALWENVKFGTHRFTHFKRSAIVGKRKWEHGISIFCKPFTTAKVKFFDMTCLEQSREWVKLITHRSRPIRPNSPTSVSIFQH